MDDAFEERKKKHEEKWAHDEALRFKIEARRTKLLGLWAAGELGHADGEAYAAEAIATELRQGPDGLIRKILADFRSAGLVHTEQVIRHKRDELLIVATEEIRHH